MSYSAFGRSWYTDLVDIYRNQDVKVAGQVTTERKPVLIASKVKCRIFTSQRPSITIPETVSRTIQFDKLACDISVPIQAGDELQISRGAVIKASLYKQNIIRYFAGRPQDYYGLNGRNRSILEHKEVTLMSEEATKGPNQ